MAEVAVNLLIEQLGALLVEEAKLLSWVSEDIAQLRNELVMMEAFLRDADQRRRNDGAVDAWVRQVRELAYSVGDSLDGFLPLLTEPSPGLGFFHKCGWYAMHYLLLHRCRISCRIRVINRRIQSVSKLKDTFSLNQTSGKTRSRARSHVYELKPLSEEDSRSLFCKTVFKLLSCPPELEELTRNILKSCGGLPLAIVLIGGLLSTREHNREEWYVASRSLVSELLGGEELGGLNRILWLSYEDLPPHLKPCYLYFGMFPEDYLVHRGMLTRQLVAEGFIVPDNNMVSLEEIAERYIGQLI